MAFKPEQPSDFDVVTPPSPSSFKGFVAFVAIVAALIAAGVIPLRV